MLDSVQHMDVYCAEEDLAQVKAENPQWTLLALEAIPLCKKASETTKNKQELCQELTFQEDIQHTGHKATDASARSDADQGYVMITLLQEVCRSINVGLSCQVIKSLMA